MAQPLGIEYVSLRDLAAWPRNPKRHDVPNLRESMRRFGFVNPIIYDLDSGMIVAGHGRIETLTAMRAANEDAPDRVIAEDEDGTPLSDWRVPVVQVHLGNLAEAEAFALADNRLVEVGGYDDAALLTLLSEMVAADQLASTGWTAADLARLSSEGDAERAAATPPDQFPTYDDDIPIEHRCPRCGYEWSGKVK